MKYIVSCTWVVILLQPFRFFRYECKIPCSLVHRASSRVTFLFSYLKLFFPKWHANCKKKKISDKFAMKDLVPFNLIPILVYTIYFFLCISPWGFVFWPCHTWGMYFCSLTGLNPRPQQWKSEVPPTRLFIILYIQL